VTVAGTRRTAGNGNRALQLGYSPTMTLNTHGRVIDELAEEEIHRPHPSNKKAPLSRAFVSGRWWTRTTDLFLIREAL
jgi:hypothetical protein